MTMKIDNQSINALRFLSVDMIQKANSGHPGMSIDAAPMAYELWENQMIFNPEDPNWINRDRFILSSGHASALLYSLLYLNKFGLSLDDLKEFRQLNSITPGHPEYGKTVGVEATTGPLGQGLGMAVGMAMAERHMSSIYNRPNFNIIDYFTYAIVGDGDLMEGISQEAISIAGTKKLSKLIVLYDSNDVTLDGSLNLSSKENTRERFEAENWDYHFVDDGNNIEQIHSAILKSKKSKLPSLIEIKNIIGYGTPMSGTNKIHGSAMSDSDYRDMRLFYKWDYKEFDIPQNVLDNYYQKLILKKDVYNKWKIKFQQYQNEYPELADLLKTQKLDTSNIFCDNKIRKISTREASQNIINDLAANNPYFWGGSADLSSSNKTYLKNQGNFEYNNPMGKNIFFGVREFGMGSAINGINLNKGTRAFASTFLVFSDYLKPAIRLAALMKECSIFIFSHDSIAVGEDGPTHQPIEQLDGLRSIPNVNVIRPADINETLGAWDVIGNTLDKPSILITSRQKLNVLSCTKRNMVSYGGYIVSDDDDIDGIIIASGSEVQIALDAKQQLKKIGLNVRVVSMPCIELFNSQSKEYKEKVLPSSITNRLAVEMGSSNIWSQFVGLHGKIIGMNNFGMSGKGSDVVSHFGFTSNNIAERFSYYFS